MKKFLLSAILSLVTVSGFAETDYFMTTQLKFYNGYDWVWSPGGDGIAVAVNYGTSTISINSQKFQIFSLFNDSPWHWNQSGHREFTANAYDEDGHQCYIRIVERNDDEGPLQMYFHYSNVNYVYSMFPVQ